MDYNALRALIETHPQWPSVTDADLLIWGEDATAVTRDREIVDAIAIYGVIDPGKFADTAGVQWWAEHINVNGGIRVTNISTGGTRTATNLRTAFIAALKSANQTEFSALIPEQVSRFEDKGLFGVRIGDLEYARTL